MCVNLLNSFTIAEYEKTSFLTITEFLKSNLCFSVNMKRVHNSRMTSNSMIYMNYL